MAIGLGTAPLTVTTQERTWRVNIETALNADPVVTIWREVVKTAADGTLVSKEPSGIVSRSLSAVTDQTVTIPGTTTPLTMAQLAATIAAVADQWRGEDVTQPAAPAAQ
jgi:hypothetical protein